MKTHGLKYYKILVLKNLTFSGSIKLQAHLCLAHQVYVKMYMNT